MPNNSTDLTLQPNLNMNFADNIKFLRLKAGLSQLQISEKLGIPRTTLGDYERGHTEPNLDTLIQIANLYDISIEYLVKKKLNDDLLRSYINRDDQAHTLSEPNTPNVELVPVHAEAGYIESLQDPEYIKELPRFSIPKLKKGPFRGFEIRGDSMLPIESGTIVICVSIPKFEDIIAGNTYVLITKENGIVYKRIVPNHKTKKLALHSDNTIFPMVEISYDEVFEIWQYQAHIAYHDPKLNYDQWQDDKLSDIQKSLLQIEKKLNKHTD